MKILTSDKRLGSIIANSLVVDHKDIKKFHGDTTIQAIIGTRQLAQKAEEVYLPNLRFIQLLSAGYEGVDIEKYRSKGVKVSNAANVYGIGMAEYIVYAMLMSAKRYNISIKNPRIRIQRGYKYITELAEKNVGILGCGSIGTQVAKRLSGFEMLVMGYDPFKERCDFIEKVYKNLEELLPLCDYLVITIPYNNQTHEMINADFLTKCKKNVTIINIGRRGLIKDIDFISALKRNKEMSAILDMFEKIPNPITNPYRRLSNVKVLPGVTAISKEIKIRLQALVEENINRIENDETPLFIL